MGVVPIALRARTTQLQPPLGTHRRPGGYKTLGLDLVAPQQTGGCSAGAQFFWYVASSRYMPIVSHSRVFAEMSFSDTTGVFQPTTNR